MTTVKDIQDFLDTVAPPYMQIGQDRIGLNCGHSDRGVDTVLIALDPFDRVCREAKEVGAQLLITHHALLYFPGFINDGTMAGKNALYLIENGIAHLNAHTNLDCAPGGVNDCLAAALGLADIQVVAPDGVDSQGRPYGLLRQGTVEAQPLSRFLANVKRKLHCQGLKYADGGKPVHKVAVGGGACADFLRQAAQAGCDTFVTADCSYHDFWEAQHLGVHLIDAGHFHTENPVCAALAEKIQRQFPAIRVLLSEKHTDCGKFY